MIRIRRTQSRHGVQDSNHTEPASARSTAAGAQGAFGVMTNGVDQETSDYRYGRGDLTQDDLMHGDVVGSADTARVPVKHALHEALLTQQGFGVAVCDSEGMLTMKNRRLEEITGQPYRPTHLHPWVSCFHLYDESGANPLAQGQDPLTRALRGCSVPDAVVSIRPSGQRTRFIRCNAAPLHGPNGEVLGAVAFVIDVTRHITARRELDQFRDLFIEIINHELRTPLATIVGHVELIHELDLDRPPQAQWSWDAITRGTARLQTVVDTITELADLATAAAMHGDRDLSWSTMHAPRDGITGAEGGPN